MSSRAEALAVRFERANQDLIDLLSTCPEGDLAVICPAEEWTAAAVAAHTANAYHSIVENVIRPVVEQQQSQPFDEAALHERNRLAAERNANLTQAEVLALLRDRGAVATAYLSALSEDDLARTRPNPFRDGAPIAVADIIEMVLIGHTEGHRESLRQELGASA